VDGTTSPLEDGPNPVKITDGTIWTGVIAYAHSQPLPPAFGARMDTGNPFQEVEGTWQQTTNAADPGGTNILSSWVGIGGLFVDGQSATFTLSNVYTDYDGRTAEWIDEPPIHGSQLAALRSSRPSTGH
jgi:hypothetical protein